MHVTQLLDKHMKTHCQGTHKRRMEAVMTLVGGLLKGRVLTVTGLGRSLRGESGAKHQIKKADRLIGNPHLHSERHSFYEAMSRLIIGATKRPVVLVDWSTGRTWATG